MRPFISFEGLDNCGKTTQIKLLTNHLDSTDVPYVLSREPGGTALGGTLRRVLKEPVVVYATMNKTFTNNPDFQQLNVNQQRTAEAEMLLFQASRAEYCQHVVKPALDEGKLFISDRFYDSTRAYQGGGRFHSDPNVINAIQRTSDFAVNGYHPSKTFLLAISYEVMLERAGKSKLDFMERLGADFFQRVAAEYDAIAKIHSQRVVRIDGTLPPEEIFEEHIKPTIDQILM